MSDNILTKIQPQQTELAAPYWEACRRGELVLQHCTGCGEFQFYPRTICSHCGDGALEWAPVSGRGRIKSFTVARRGISKAYEAPYVIALVDLAEGPCMMSNIVGAAPEQVHIGAEVTVAFQSWGSEQDLPVFELAEV